MTVIHHTRMAPAGIQKQWQRIFIQAIDMKEGATHPAAATAGISPVYDFDPDTEQSLHMDVGIPLDWMAPTDWYAYPVFATSSGAHVYAPVRWGIEYVAMWRGVSIAGATRTIERNIYAGGSAVVIPRKTDWLTLEGSRICPNEPLFQMDDFTSRASLQIRLYRAAASALDTHPGNARLLGLALVYQAFI